MTANVLALNADFRPLKVISWQQAVLMLLDGRADLVVEYVGRLIRSTSTSIPWPAVIRLRRFVSLPGRLRFNRQNVLARDGYQCQYCGIQPRNKVGRPNLRDLTIDHVIPRTQSKDGQVRAKDGRMLNLTSWPNVVCCCSFCNLQKGGRTPEQAGMRLLNPPRIPSSLDIVKMALLRTTIPTEWIQFLPPGMEEWAGYWQEELLSD